MEKFVLKKFFKFPFYVKLSPELEREFRNKQCHNFVGFFRYALLFGMVAYCIMILSDWISASKIFFDILIPRLTMLGIFLVVFTATFYKNFYIVSRHVGVIFILILMFNVLWIQGLIEKGLEEGYGMLITPGTTTSVIVFSGAEMGYGALLTPLLLLPLGFSALQAFITSLLVVLIVNIGMLHADLPSAFVSTANSVFISIGIFTTILAYLVTQQRRAAFQLEYKLRISRDEALEANKAKSNFLATMSHEVRTPLNGILGMASLLLQTRLNKKQEDYLQTVKYSGEALLSMLNDILDFSKMESSKFEIEKIDVDLIKLVNSVADLMTSRAEEKGIFIKVDIDSNVPKYIHSDPTRIRQVLLNLLSNAIKFTDKGFVMIALKNIKEAENSTILRFEVIDTGIGIPAESKQKLFQEFTQADSSTSRKYGGTGLGLSICKRIIDLLGGKIDIDSVVGRGSTFWFEIPVQVIDEMNFSEEGKKSNSVPQLQPLTILVAEDNKINLQITSDFLSMHHHKVHAVKDGQEAVDAMKEHNFDIVLMDMQMPHMDGVEAVKIIKSWENEKSLIPVIALTANNMESDIETCRAAGMVGYITKPFDKYDLFQALAVQLPEKIIDSTDIAAINVHDIKEDEIDLSALKQLEETFDRDYVIKFLGKYLPTIGGYVDKILCCDAEKDQEEILRIMHQLKGVGTLCGFSELHNLAEEIEESYAESDYNNVAILMNRLQKVFENNLCILKQIYPFNNVFVSEVQIVGE